jgi:hypothetical protein
MSKPACFVFNITIEDQTVSQKTSLPICSVLFWTLFWWIVLLALVFICNIVYDFQLVFFFLKKTQMETVAAKENSQCGQIYFLFFGWRFLVPF